MPKRKTVKVVELVKEANLMLRNSTCEPEVRQGVINFLEHFLHETGSYKGVAYLTEKEVPEGQKPGIRMGYDERKRMVMLPYEERFLDVDSTRVQY